jgi:MFS family permease
MASCDHLAAGHPRASSPACPVTSAEQKISRSHWLALGAMALGVFVIANDFTALSVAIPRIEADLHASLSRAQWVINGYALVFGVLIVTGGRLADLFGRKRITLFAMFVTARAVPESATDTTNRSIDVAGIGILSCGAVAVLLALDLGTDSGFGAPYIIALIVAGLALLGSFFLVERRQGDKALVPAAIMRNRVFSAACLTVLFISATFFSALLYLPQFMEKVLGFSALRSGAGLLPLMGVFAVTSFVAGWLYGRVGPKAVVTSGTACLAIGIGWLSFISSASSYRSLLPGMLVLGLGVGLFYSSVTTAAVTALDPSQASLAGGIVYMCQVAGGAIGLGLNTAIVLSSASLADGIKVAFRVDGALAVAGTAVSLWFVHGPRRSAAHADAARAHHRVRA